MDGSGELPALDSKAVTREYLHLSGGRHIHYRTVEESVADPLMLMIHQTPLHSGHYSKVLPLLSAFCRPVAIDTPGYGLSDPPEGDWEISQYAELVWQVVDHLGAGEIVLFGRATGSIIALEAARLEHERVRALVLHGLPVYSKQMRTERLGSGFAEPIHPKANGGHLAELWDRIRKQYPFLDPSEVQWHLEAYLACGTDFGTAYRAMWRYDPEPALNSLKMPVHLLGGNRDRVFHWFDAARGAIPTASHHVFTGGTDFVAAHDPRAFCLQIKSFLATLDIVQPEGTSGEEK